jgi:hypothetical protein
MRLKNESSITKTANTTITLRICPLWGTEFFYTDKAAGFFIFSRDSKTLATLKLP